MLPFHRFPVKRLICLIGSLIMCASPNFNLKAADDPSLSYLALGDSYTIGEGVKPAQRWPVRLAKALRSADLPVADPTIIAKTGWTTDELLAAIREANPAGNRDLVTLLIGVNNQYRGQPLDKYQREFTELLRMAIELTAGKQASRVIVVSIPDYGLTPFIAGKPERDPKTIAKDLDAYNQAAKEITEQHQAQWVDITPVSRQLGSQPRMLAEDGLHPSGRMYGKWVELILPVAKQTLE